MKKSYVLFTTCIVFTFFLAINVPGEKMRDKNSLDLTVKTRDMRTENMGGLKPDINFGKFPLYFITNKGQVNKKAKFYARALRYTLWLTEEGLVFDSFKRSKVKGERSKEESGDLSPTSPHSSYTTERDVSRLLFVGANKNPAIVPVEEAKLKVNYFIGNDRCKWHCDVPTSQAVLYKNLYKNIDLKIYGIEKQIEYDWIVKPGGNPLDIKFVYKNVKGTCIDEEGNLLIKTDFGEFVHKKPVSYQTVKGNYRLQNTNYKQITSSESQSTFEILRSAAPPHPGAGITEADSRGLIYQTRTAKNSRNPVDVRFKKIGKNTFSFAVGDYDKSRELIIDPVVLAYSTYLGGSNSERGNGIAVDSSGYVYVTGDTLSTDFPTLNPYQADQGSYDVFVTKIDPTQSGAASLIYSTYLGGGRGDDGHGIAVDSSGNVYVTGYTESLNFPTRNPYQGTFQGGYDVFVAKIDTTQSGAAGLIYSTYLGGGYYECGNGIAVDSSGYVYVTGGTSSSDFPTLNQYQTDQRVGDVFVTKIDPTQSGAASLIYSTYLGGSGSEGGFGTALDSSGYVYVTGYTYSTDFPTLDQYQAYQGSGDIFVTKIDPTQSGAAGLIYSTYLGGSDYDVCYGIAVDSSGYVYMIGDTYSTDFPTLNPYQGTFQGSRDVFVTRIDPTQSGAASLIYSTYLGGQYYDDGNGIAVDSSGYVYVTGYTESLNFPTLNPYQGTLQGSYDVFVTKIEPYPPLTVPIVTTRQVSSITSTSAVCGGKVTSDGGAAVTHRGVCWNNTGNPTTGDINTVDGSGIGSFTSYITGLTPDTTYYVRAYAKNSVGTAYGKVREFKTLKNPSISGTITGSSGTGTADVTLTFSNSGGTTKTNQDGYYSHTVEKNWSGTVTPSKTGYVFKPAKRTYNTLTSDRCGQDYTAYEITLSLTVSRETESAWIIKRQYGKIELGVDNPGGITVSKYVIYRKEAGGNYTVIKEIPGSQFQGSTYSYYDRFLDKDKSYTYKFTALDAQGVNIATSDEKIIQSQSSASFTIKLVSQKKNSKK